ncbi:hypothetical protein KKD57_04650 [Patescibacteria group bacterium]|nr:hypothetical protein [Patescibacteria group bacterium]
MEKIHTFEKARIGEDGKVEEIQGGIFIKWTNATFVCGDPIPKYIETPDKIVPLTVETTFSNF